MDSIVLMICVWQQGAVAAITWVCGVPLLGVVAKIFTKWVSEVWCDDKNMIKLLAW